jgi:NADH:ubiquinone oxidoreductase subunit 6 (subunit J)
MLILLLAVIATIFAIGAIRAKRLIVSSIWLAGVSAIISIIFYLFGARQVAVIELSVGSGLVTVLFVFAISIAGDEAVSQKPILPKPFIIGLLFLIVVLLGWYLLPTPITPNLSESAETSLTNILWQQRGLDVLVQVVLIFSGVLGLLGLLAEIKAPLEGSAAEEVAGARERELQALEGQILGGDGGEQK